MVRTTVGPAEVAGPVLAGIMAAATAEDVLRCCFAEAGRREVGVRVLLAGPVPEAGVDVLVGDLVDRWAEKHPAVPVTVEVRRGLDAAITLTAATLHCGLVVVAEPADAQEAAVAHALARRAHCPLVVAPPHLGPVEVRPGP